MVLLSGMWEVVSQNWLYLLVGAYPRGELGGIALTLVISILALVLTFPAAVLMALARTSGIKWLSRPAFVFVYIVRSIPILMLIFWAYFIIPLILGFPISPFVTLVTAIIVYQTAYLSEVIRAGIEAIPKGQIEAARALGLRYVPITFRIVLPQALYNVLPGMLNQLTAIIKESSLGSIISVHEVTFAAMQINAVTVTRPFETFAVLALGYFILCYSLSRAAGYLELRINRRRQGGQVQVAAEA